jgi:hypothetical protein
MSFVDLPRFKNNSTDYMSQKISGNISKKSAEKNPLNFGKKIPESREKLPGFSNPKNLRTLFSE